MGRKRQRGQLTSSQKRRLDDYIKKHKEHILKQGLKTFELTDTPANRKRLYATFRTYTLDKMDNYAKYAGNKELLGWAMRKTLNSSVFTGEAGIMKNQLRGALRKAGKLKEFHKLTRNQRFDESKLTQTRSNQRSNANGIRAEYRYEYREGKVIYMTLYYEDGEGRWELSAREN